MKKISFLALLLLTAVSCNEFDDSAIWDKLDNHEARIVQLETMCNQMNTNISSLQTIVQGLQKNDYVTSIISIVENGKEIGYSISFSSGITIKIYHGNDGKDGNDGTNGIDGQTPAIGTRQDTDGIYYWTVNGEWLLDDSGNKIPTTGKDGTNGADGKDGQDGSEGITPQLKIEEDYWYISYDNGATWTQLGQATGEDGANGTDGVDGKDGQDGDSMFSDIDITGTDYVVLTLADGTQIKIPTWKAFENLQTMVNQMNTNIEALQTIVEVLQSKDYVTSVTPLVENNLVIGYSIAFDKSGEIVIYHGTDGQDGEDGKDGATPEIGIRQDSDGLWYWTLNGEWLLDESGNKVPAAGKDGADGTDGKDGITPQLKIEEDYWHVSYDNGETWQHLYKMTDENGVAGTNGDALFQSIVQDDTSVTLTLADGTSIVVPKFIKSEFAITFDETDGIYCDAGHTVVVAFTIIGGGDNASVECLGENGWTGKAVMSDQTSGTIKVTAPSPITDGKILVLATNGTKEIVMKALTFTDKILKSVTDVYEVSYSGGDISVPISTSLEYYVNIPTDAQFWISHTATKALMAETLIFTIAENPDEAPRSADVEIISTDGTMSFTITIVQNAQPSSAVIEFADEVMKELCVTAFDTNGDGELSYKEAAAVTDLSQMTLTKKTFKSFDEFQYFINVKTIPNSYFSGIGIKSIILPAGLRKIGLSAFKNCALLQEIYIPEGVTAIEDSAFYGCTSLTSITIPESVTSIGSSAFSGCTSLTSITIPESVTSIGRSAFFRCTSLTSITISKRVTAIEDYAFYGCTSLTSITIPESVTAIGMMAFQECTGLTSITLPENMMNIYRQAFSGCTSLTTINIPESVTSIGNLAFYGCTGLTSITIPESVTSIEASVFYGCTNLTSITIPESVTAIEGSAFRGCTSLTNITIPESVTSIGGDAFSGCTSLTNITIPESMTSIESSAFSRCTGLTNITIPESVTSIGSSAFSGCTSLTNITIPESVTSIGTSAFSACNKLDKTYLKPIVPPTITDTNCFMDNASDRKFYVPSESVEAYKTADIWSSFADYIVGYDFENETVVE